jgi:trimethylamine--corrinoid protein Co-methyltransferase
LLGASFEAFVIDNEMHAAIYRMLRGVEVSDATLGFDTICQVVMGEGHFLGAGQTHAAMERDYFYPSLADRDAPITWAEKGAPDMWARARLRVRDILRDHRPTYVSPDQDNAIRALFPGLIRG